MPSEDLAHVRDLVHNNLCQERHEQFQNLVIHVVIPTFYPNSVVWGGMAEVFSQVIDYNSSL